MGSEALHIRPHTWSIIDGRVAAEDVLTCLGEGHVGEVTMGIGVVGYLLSGLRHLTDLFPGHGRGFASHFLTVDGAADDPERTTEVEFLEKGKDDGVVLKQTVIKGKGHGYFGTIGPAV